MDNKEIFQLINVNLDDVYWAIHDIKAGNDDKTLEYYQKLDSINQLKNSVKKMNEVIDILEKLNNDEKLKDNKSQITRSINGVLSIDIDTSSMNSVRDKLIIGLNNNPIIKSYGLHAIPLKSEHPYMPYVRILPVDKKTTYYAIDCGIDVKDGRFGIKLHYIDAPYDSMYNNFRGIIEDILNPMSNELDEWCRQLNKIRDEEYQIKLFLENYYAEYTIKKLNDA